MPQSRQRNQRRHPSVPRGMPSPAQSGQREVEVIDTPLHKAIVEVRPGASEKYFRIELSTKNGRLMTLDQPKFGKRNDFVAGHDEMVDDPHVHQAQCRLQGLRQQFISPRGLGFARWMIVGKGQRCSISG